MDFEPVQIEGDASASKDADEMEDLLLTAPAETSTANPEELALKLEEPETPAGHSLALNSDVMFGGAPKEPVVKAEPQLESTDAFKPLKVRSQSDNDTVDGMAIDGADE